MSGLAQDFRWPWPAIRLRQAVPCPYDESWRRWMRKISRKTCRLIENEVAGKGLQIAWRIVKRSSGPFQLPLTIGHMTMV